LQFFAEREKITSGSTIYLENQALQKQDKNSHHFLLTRLGIQSKTSYLMNRFYQKDPGILCAIQSLTLRWGLLVFTFYPDLKAAPSDRVGVASGFI